ncbi:DNA-binding protein [Candidatus Woesearchaeota archaeon]|nr:DNA-binding protein [Candidatus Woesearchaeota archaeon]|tara:strand:+ start:422 stop:802 length:381 start_codon:yes stop_codon:yes gene_type:complete
MKISELTARQGNVEVTGEVTEVEEPRTFNKAGKEGRVTNAILKDDSGQIKLSLWNEQIDAVKQGSKITIKNGYVNEWQGELQLTTGKFGTLEVGESAGPVEELKEETPAEEKKEEPSSVKEESLGE